MAKVIVCGFTVWIEGFTDRGVYGFDQSSLGWNKSIWRRDYIPLMDRNNKATLPLTGRGRSIKRTVMPEFWGPNLLHV